MDRAFLTATAVPLMGLAGAILYKFRPLDWQKQEGKQVSWICSFNLTLPWMHGSYNQAYYCQTKRCW